MNRQLWNGLLVTLLALLLLTGCAATAADQTTAIDQATAAGDGFVVAGGAAAEPADDAGLPPADGAAADGADRPVGWTSASHSNDVDPNYDVVFPEDQVNTITITIAPENWAVMQEDMLATYGEPGTRQNGRLQPPDGAGAQPMPPGEGERSPQGDGAMPPGGGPPDGGPPAGGPGGLILGDNDPVYVPATVTFGDNTWEYVGVRFKGNSSLMSTWSSGGAKFSFKLDFDEFEDDYPQIDNQRFYGFKQLNLNNNFNDASFMRETVAAELFADAGLAVAETAFYAVYVDVGDGPVYYGLYTMVEEVDDTVIERTFGDDDGNLYKPEGATLAAGSYNEASFGKKSNEDEGDYGDVATLYDALHDESRSGDPAAWRAGLEAVFDVDIFLRWLAANSVMQNWDTYGRMSHNFYLYNDPATGLLTWMPWDSNESLKSGNGPQGGALSLALDEVDDRWPLIRFLLDDPVYQAAYAEYVDWFAAEIFTVEAMTARYEELATLLAPYALAEAQPTSFLRDDGAFAEAVTALQAHVVDRQAAVAAFLANTP